TESNEDILDIKHCSETMITWSAKSVSNPLRLPDWMPTSENNEYWKARARVYAYIDSVLDARLAMDESEYPDDLLSKLILAEDPETGERMSRELLRDEALTNFFA